MTTLVLQIARAAREKLGRPAHRSRRFVDWGAVDAIKAAAREAGLTGSLCEWVQPRASLRQHAEDFIARYVQAYGPQGSLIDVGAHLGMRRPAIIDLDHLTRR